MSLSGFDPDCVKCEEMMQPYLDRDLSDDQVREAEAHLDDQRKEGALGTDAGAATAITADSPPHYFRMMKELTMLGYFTSEIGMTKAQRYAETPGKYDPCVPYKPGDKAWAPHA